MPRPRPYRFACLKRCGYVFETVFLLAAGAIALWLDVRFPGLAPETLERRMGVAVLAVILVGAVPVIPGDPAVLLVSLFAGVFPAFVLALLTALWLLRGVRDRLSA